MIKLDIHNAQGRPYFAKASYFVKTTKDKSVRNLRFMLNFKNKEIEFDFALHRIKTLFSSFKIEIDEG